MKKKYLLAAAGVMSIFALAACGNSNNQEVASMKGGKITVSDFYNEAKENSASQGIVRNMVIFKVFDAKYGKDVSNKDVDKEYQKQVENFGGEETFKQQLAAAGMSEKNYKEQVRQNLTLETGLKAHIKLTDEDLKAAWDKFHPEVDAQIIVVDSEDAAKEVEKAAKEKDADFGKIAKEKSAGLNKEDGGKIKFDSDAKEIPEEVKEAAFKLKEGDISEPIASMNMSTYSTNYYVVKMNKKQEKGNDMDKFKKEIEEAATEAKLSDQTFVTKVIGEELQAANVKIADPAFENVLTEFISAADGNKDKKADNKKDKEKTEESTKDSE